MLSYKSVCNGSNPGPDPILYSGSGSDQNGPVFHIRMWIQHTWITVRSTFARYWTPLILEKGRNNLSKDDKISQTQSAKIPRKSCFATRGAQFVKSFRTYPIGIKDKLKLKLKIKIIELKQEEKRSFILKNPRFN